MTQRIRSKAFAALLLQEVAYFDQPENSSGAISTRLSSDAAAIQKMTGTRLGIVCETLAMFSFGLIVGTWISWQLMLVTLFSLLIYVAVAYADIYLQTRANKQIEVLVGRASTVR